MATLSSHTSGKQVTNNSRPNSIGAWPLRGNLYKYTSQCHLNAQNQIVNLNFQKLTHQNIVYFGSEQLV